MTPFAAFVRAARGPLLLIALGVLMALHRSHDVSFTKTWPVLLILFGLMKLFERLAQRQQFDGEVQP
ncbi:MAG: DUF5668 domain-containing protein [Bryobacteraceae bacterium]|nr:hypothetical protein [Solibacteraceae bacterium]MCL4840597.1 hypothetical protein [Bryobacteraceae bacterium]MCO5350551.1 DUF5668 domain-containing protein [Bryobacteraceae bacterium]HAX42332.1 hypothetical protein [Bryobacterales bacterium]HRJ17967.1 DUF5668 domain-containing protein [Bryobacteraceae bacterium]